MKKAIQYLTILAVLISFTSCEKLTDVNFNTAITERIPIHIDKTTGTAVSLDESIIMNLDNDDTHDYLNHIKDIEIKRLTYKLIDFTGDETGTVDVQFYMETNPLIQNDIIVKTEVDNATVFEITDVQALITIATVLKNGHQVTARYAGEALSENEAMDFKVEITLELAITANPI